MGQSGRVNDFKNDLAYSLASSTEAFWDAVYKKAFPGMTGSMLCPNAGPTQHMGIDRVILLSNGRCLYVDEKKRREKRGDILLEYLSNDRTGALGWIEKDLSIDYLAYAFMETRQVYLYAWPLLRRAWLHYGPEWKEKYRIPPVINSTYKTFCVAIPIVVLNSAVQLSALIDVSEQFHDISL